MIVDAPLQLHSEKIIPEWIDYNGHMNLAYYVLVFDHATDAFLDYIGLTEDFREQNQSSTFAAEIHTTYEQEVKEGDEVIVRTRLLGFDEKRIHYFHQMYHKNEGWLSATNEVISLYVDMNLRKVSVMPSSILDCLGEIEKSHSTLPVAPQVGQKNWYKKEKHPDIKEGPFSILYWQFVRPGSLGLYQRGLDSALELEKEYDMRKIPAIKSEMTPFPYSVDVSDSIQYAYEFLQKHELGHLPIKDGNELKGVVSKREIRGFILEMVDTKEERKVGDLRIGNSHIVDLNERLDHVLEKMAELHLDSALVTRNGRLAGIFTTTDVCNAFVRFLNEQFGPPGGDEAA